MASIHDQRTQRNQPGAGKPEQNPQTGAATLRDEQRGTSVHARADGRTVERIEPTSKPNSKSKSGPGSNGVGNNGAVRGLPDLLRDLRDEAITLVRQELHLARTEMSQKLDEAQRILSASAVGLALLLSGLVTLTLGAAAGLYAGLVALEIDNMIAGWVAPVAVGIVVLSVGAFMASRAKKLGDADHWRPKRTERSIRETRDWAERKVEA